MAELLAATRVAMNELALWREHRLLAFAVARNYFLPGADAEDVCQEALIGLWDAARRYDTTKGPFRPFAIMVIRRRLQECVSKANAHKHAVLTEAAPLDGKEPQQDTTWQAVLLRDSLRTLRAALRSLTALELEAVQAHLGGSYTSKNRRLENGLTRARAKLTEALS